jgi:excisionase family DNA binding protein
MPSKSELTTGQAALFLGVKTASIKHHILKGRIGVVRIVGKRSRMICAASFRRFLVSRGVSTEAFDLALSEGEYLNQAEAALILGVAKPTINEWLKLGVIPATIVPARNGKGQSKISRVDFDEFCRKNSFKPGDKFRRIWPPKQSGRPQRPARPKPIIPDLSGFLTQTEAGRLIGVSQARVTKLVTSGEIPSVEVKAGTGRILRKIHPEAVARFKRKKDTPGLTTAEVAKRLGVGNTTAWNLIKSGRIKGINLGLGWQMGYRVLPSDLKRFMAQR